MIKYFCDICKNETSYYSHFSYGKNKFENEICVCGFCEKFLELEFKKIIEMQKKLNEVGKENVI